PQAERQTGHGQCGGDKPASPELLVHDGSLARRFLPVAELFHDRGACATRSFGLESYGQSRSHTVVDQFEQIVVLMTLLVLEEVREVIADLELDRARPPVHEAGVGVCMALLQIHGAALLAQAVHFGEAATRDSKSQQPMVGEHMTPAHPRDRNRQLLEVEVLAVLASLMPAAGERR